MLTKISCKKIVHCPNLLHLHQPAQSVAGQLLTVDAFPVWLFLSDATVPVWQQLSVVAAVPCKLLLFVGAAVASRLLLSIVAVVSCRLVMPVAPVPF